MGALGFSATKAKVAQNCLSLDKSAVKKFSLILEGGRGAFLPNFQESLFLA